MQRWGVFVGLLASVVVLITLSSFAGASAAGVPASGPVTTSASTATAPVYIHFSPKSVTVAPGGTFHLGAVVKNKGPHSFVATSCILWFRIGTSGAWTREGSCLKSSDFPHTFSAHSKSKFGHTETVSKTASAGTYQWKIVLVGTYNSASEDSHAGIFTFTIT